MFDTVEKIMEKVVVPMVKALVPPSDPEDETEETRGTHSKRVQAWRNRVALVLGASIVGLGIHVALACGLVPFLWSGFAVASDAEQKFAKVDQRMAQFETKIDTARINSLKTAILEMRIRHCRSDIEILKTQYWSQLTDMLSEYQDLKKQAYPLPDCREIRIDAANQSSNP